MKRIALVLMVLALAGLAVACDAFSSALPPPTEPPAAAATPRAPVGACNSRLGGKLTNTTTKKSPSNATVEVSNGSKTIKTITDPNGLYGFAGLCAGEYSITFTPPGAKSIAHPNKIKLDGAQPLKVDLNYQ